MTKTLYYVTAIYHPHYQKLGVVSCGSLVTTMDVARKVRYRLEQDRNIKSVVITEKLFNEVKP